MKYETKQILECEIFSDEFVSIVEKNSELYKLCTGMIWSEGPVFTGEGVIFSDVKDNKMFYFSLQDGLSIYRTYSNYSNGNYLDREGRLVSCEHGRRCISRTEKDGTVSILVDKYEGKRLNSPNDIVVKSDGTIWFTDPPYGITGDAEGYKSMSQIIGCYVYKFDTKTKLLEAVITDTQRPNGLAFSPDESILYVADMSLVDFPTYGRRHIRAYTMIDGMPQEGRNFVCIEPGIPDGFRVDKKGRLYVSFEHGIKIVNAEGAILGSINIPEKVSNCCFGKNQAGDDLLFITASTSLYCVKVNLEI